MITQNYQNQTILITGAASGIGAAQLNSYLALGAKVIALDKAPIETINERLFSYEINLANEEQLSQWLLDHQALLSDVDIFLSTAGVLDAFKPALATNYQAIKANLQINLLAPIQISEYLLPILQQRHGQIVFMASIAGQIAGGGGAAYTTAKHGLIGWMRQLALDYAKSVRINAIAPGAIDTPMNAADFAGDGAMAKAVAAETPVGRWAQASEVANLTLYLTSPEASYMQGQVINLDGGWTIK
ncbi:3-ketoacyl-ACP reductase [Weissella oryzae SG25]|uniref:3-ketoacyl-ACP reductase n=1 Tax=Weissella oryzae (strain DSM 25784 / JCM 18191 / LMG 30913 / SG25) TaxID=1329250 RepID=A0A069D172_WEIOS|nr:3-oxoacyl-ACP reductase [Weissella oryzae]GAK31106.1 3-ketoacyl-ACP reductase [Weissella oryzae SG25]